MSTKNTETIKGRYWTFIVYEESAPPDWVGELRRSHGSYAISPVHAPDGEHNKPHHHVIYCHGNSTTLGGVRLVVPDDVPANGWIEVVGSPTNLQRYLIHLDDPDKEQFAEGINAITVLNGFALDMTRELSKADKARLRLDLIAMIREHNITEYSEFIFALADLGDPDLLDYACTHTMLFEGVIRSLRNRVNMAQRERP